MKVLIGSKNPSKISALELALKELKILNFEIISYDVPSNVSSKPIGHEIIKGADNRNQALKECAVNLNIQYDYLCSIEGGYMMDENNSPVIVTYVITESLTGEKFIGKSLKIKLSNTMYEYVKKGNSLNKIIEKILENENNKQKGGVTGYLTDGIYDRIKIDKDAIILSFVPFIFNDKIKLLDQKIIEK